MNTWTQYTIHPTGQQVLQVLAETAAYHNKTYCFPNQRTILKSLKIRFGKIMSRRSLCRWTKYLEDAGYIKKQQRHRRGKSGQLELHSTLYTFRRQAVKFLASLSRRIAQLVGFTAVTEMAQSTPSKVVSQPETCAKGARTSPTSYENGLRKLKDLLSP